MAAIAEVMRGGCGRFYIRPLSAGLNGVVFDNAADATRVADAVNAAYLRGMEDVRSGLRDLIGAAKDTGLDDGQP